MFKLISTVLFLTITFTSCGQLFDSGTATLLDEITNRKGNKKAILFLKGGNATADNSLQITVSDADYKLDNEEVGNTFTADSDHNSTVQDANSIKLKWISNDTLQISYDKKLRTFIQKGEIDDVTIIYKIR